MIWIGTSGWVYKHWIGCFYPPEMKQRDWLRHYASVFPTVEINRSFYRLPSRQNFEAWGQQAGFHWGFQFAVKASRYLTHVKRLKDPDQPIWKLVEAADGLGYHKGPFLYQMPPRWNADPGRLRHFISRLPPWHKAAFEFRDYSWYNGEIYHILGEAGHALVRAIGGYHTPMEVPDVGPFRYIRVHGGQWGIGLTEGELQYWADRIANDTRNGVETYIYFNNDPECHALYNAWRLRDMLAYTGALAP